MGSWSRKQRILLPYTFLRGTHVQTYAHVHVYAGHTGMHFFLLSVYRKYKGDCLQTKSHSRQTKSIVTCRIAGEVFVCSEFYPPVEFHSCDKQVGQKDTLFRTAAWSFLSVPQLGHSSMCPEGSSLTSQVNSLPWVSWPLWWSAASWSSLSPLAF